MRATRWACALVGAASAAAFVLVGCTSILDDQGATPPAVSIVSPSSDTTYLEGDSILFQANVSDNFDNNRIDSLVWRTDVSGRVGEGTLFRSTLPGGSHTVRATAHDDEAGHTTTATTRVEVVTAP